MEFNKIEVEKFINKAFEYLNGRVNIFNYPATIEVEWAELWDRSTGAIYRDPNIVIIYPRVIWRYFPDEYNFKYNILISIIHELYHIDQEISCVRMLNDREYYNYIEKSVELESYLWMAQHQQEIFNIIGFQDVYSYNTYYNVIRQFETGRLYKRRNYFTHCLIMLKSIVYSDKHELLDVFTRIFNNSESVIDVVFNNESKLCIKKGLECCPVEQLNSVFRAYIFDYTLRNIKTRWTEYSNGNLVIYFDIIGKYIMCKYKN